MAAVLETEIEELNKILSNTLLAKGEDRIQKCQSACLLLLKWLAYLRDSEQTGCCDEMLTSLQSCLIEAAGSISMGLVRYAIFSMRAQIDLAVAWLFYKDHPVEWNAVVATGDGFLLKRDVFEHLSTYNERFNIRMNLLEKHKRRTISDPYRVLSAHIHGQSALVIPKFKKLKEMVYPDNRCEEAIQLQREVGEYISDTFISLFGDKWASLPKEAIKDAQARVPSDKHPILFG
jgi:hypothetical protein